MIRFCKAIVISVFFARFLSYYTHCTGSVVSLIVHARRFCCYLACSLLLMIVGIMALGLGVCLQMGSILRKTPSWKMFGSVYF